MIEIDEQGKEWFGYSVGGGDLKDPVSVVDTFWQLALCRMVLSATGGTKAADVSNATGNLV